LLGHKCSVHWCYEAAFKAEFPDIVATDRVITIDRKRATASGAGAVFDLMLRLIDTELGPEVTTEVACWFQHPFVRGEDIVQKIPAIRSASTNDMLPPAISRAIKMFDEQTNYGQKSAAILPDAQDDESASDGVVLERLANRNRTRGRVCKFVADDSALCSGL
jgi:transcriptional regulator GlxA family with amidase domain